MSSQDTDTSQPAPAAGGRAVGYESTVGAVYTGALDFNGKWVGAGELRYADGTTYAGTFRDGQFDGRGVLTLPNGAAYAGVWRAGREVVEESSYVWADGLAFDLDRGRAPGAGAEGWAYLKAPDRRLWAGELDAQPHARPAALTPATHAAHAQTGARGAGARAADLLAAGAAPRAVAAELVRRAAAAAAAAGGAHAPAAAAVA